MIIGRREPLMLIPRPIAEAKTLLTMGALLLLAGMAAWSAIRGRGPIGAHRIAAEDCRAGYRRARTAADSSMVDYQTPIVSKTQAAFAKSCKMMRLDGDLNRFK